MVDLSGRCALNREGKIYCWDSKVTPTEAMARVFSGHDSNCGVTTGGDLVCWGALGSVVPRTKGPFLEVAIGEEHVCALRRDGIVKCWGTESEAIHPPPGTFRAIAGGGGHTCGLTGEGIMLCWGVTAVGLASPGTFVAIASGHGGTCGIERSGQVLCANAPGSSGGVAMNVPGGRFTQLSVGWSHACGLRDGAVVCWGYSGDRKTQAPAGIFSAVSVRSEESCGLRPDGKIVCWGALEWPDEPRPTR